jgi:asparagine synthase (glutamine-hydrolysing)
MCGIAGHLHLNLPPDLGSLEAHSKCFQSRGPDNYGAKVIKNLGLCHRRLSIIDLDDRSNQPMETGALSIVYNGEIYNFQELKAELITSGKTFKTASDTEVILAAYEYWGIEKTLERLEGMFAFALFDDRRSKLFLARDIYGQKPLYWHKGADQLLFSSDIRFISGQVSNLTIDEDSLNFYFQELAMPQPKTIWKQIQQIDPGHFLEVDTKNLDTVTRNYHQFDFNQSQMGWEEAMEKVEVALEKSIMKRMVADVPVACFLSGGIDSGLIVSLLAKNSTEKVNTFSVGFREEEFNELPYAKQLAEKYGTNHMELLIEPDIESDIYSILSDLGEPFGDSSLIPSYLVTKHMATFYKVALSGDGGDELFGYPSYSDFFELETFFDKVPKNYRKLKINGSKLFSRFGIGENLGRFKNHISTPPNGDCLNRGMVFSSNEMNLLFQNQKLDYTGRYLDLCWNSSNASTITNRVVAGSLKSRLQNDYLTKVDRASMMNSLEVRSPFLDKHLGSLAFCIPNSVKFRGSQPKALLKELAKMYIDPKIHQRKKVGFGIPINHWLRKELKPLLSEYLSSGNLKKHDLFNEKFVNNVVNEHISGSEDHRHKLWCLLSFQIWFENHG